jgi:hypothetical protein
MKQNYNWRKLANNGTPRSRLRKKSGQAVTFRVSTDKVVGARQLIFRTEYKSLKPHPQLLENK